MAIAGPQAWRGEESFGQASSVHEACGTSKSYHLIYPFLFFVSICHLLAPLIRHRRCCRSWHCARWDFGSCAPLNGEDAYVDAVGCITCKLPPLDSVVRVPNMWMSQPPNRQQLVGIQWGPDESTRQTSWGLFLRNPLPMDPLRLARGASAGCRSCQGRRGRGRSPERPGSAVKGPFYGRAVLLLEAVYPFHRSGNL